MTQTLEFLLESIYTYNQDILTYFIYTFCNSLLKQKNTVYPTIYP